MKTSLQPTLTIDGREIEIADERNLLELIRKADIDLPTFCYHSELSIYGACRLCLVDVEGRGIMAACSTPPEPGMKLRTVTDEIREIRKISVELLLANHDQSCPTCARSANCQLQTLARQLGIEQVRFKPVQQRKPIDTSSHSLVRDPNKCVLCGDCVRMCSEIQDIGAIDFAFRGHDVAVLPAMGKDLAEVACVNCGQCATVCPTGALTVKSEMELVWKAIADKSKTVVAQIAPAVRVGLGEAMGLKPGEIVTGQIVAAIRRLGFDQVYDTSFAADLTVTEEATEFLKRKANGKHLPQFTSCCPGWVKYAEQFFPEILPNLSTCKSPQQMVGSLLKEILPEQLGVKRGDVIVVSIMPCTAKKFEARREEFTKECVADVDFVLTTQELARMIQSSGIRFDKLQPESFDMPFGFYTGAGVIFGASGGVTEAVLRFAAEKVTGEKLKKVDFEAVRGESGLREANVKVGDAELRLAVVHGLRNARVVAEQVRSGKSQYDLIEVMACPGGCVGGAGQPVTTSREARAQRRQGLYKADRESPLHKSQENPYITETYARCLGEVGGEKAHHLLHTHYVNRRRMEESPLPILQSGDRRLNIGVCVGTNCYVKGSQQILQKLLQHVAEHSLSHLVDIRAMFCTENCEHGPTVLIGDERITKCTAEQAIAAVEEQLQPATAD
ncbi:MAG TPA: NADH-dependent [FeFe] hydrogenase, group A6 [candidate division Zixibacteria bacterium]|nr:NADH-dependent [FeFe] hydrogenase, group A6 [candidate division Zixibacteria bacterium]